MTYAEKVCLIFSYKFNLPQQTFLQFVGFWLAYTLPTIIFLLCPLILFYGRHRYARTPPTDSVFSTALHLWGYAARGRWSINPIKTWRNLRADDFWENVKPSRINESDRPKWMTFDDQWVDEVRRGFKACAVFCWFPLWCEFRLSSNSALSILTLPA